MMKYFVYTYNCAKLWIFYALGSK